MSKKRIINIKLSLDPNHNNEYLEALEQLQFWKDRERYYRGLFPKEAKYCLKKAEKYRNKMDKLSNK